MHKSIRTKLKLNNQQKTLTARHAGYSRWCYNWGLSLWNAAYKDGEKPNTRKLRVVFTNHTKPLYPWMKNLSYKVYQYAFINLGEAFKRFFSYGMLRKQGLGKYPRLKKKGKHDSFPFLRNATQRSCFPTGCYANANTIDNCGKPIELNGWNHKLPFLGLVKTYEPIEATTQKITISRQAGDWYLSCSYEFTPTPTPKTTEVVDVDLGVKTLATLSDGKIFKSVKSYRRFEAKLSRQQYINRHKIIGSANWKKAQLKIARLHRRVANIRQDAIHKLTTYLAKNHNPPPSPPGRGARRVGADQSFYEFRPQLEYKCQWYGCELVIVDRFFPSTKTCSNCSHVQDMPLNNRTYECGCCGISIDRDLNTSINLTDAVGLTVNSCGRSAADSSGGSRK